MELHGPHSQIFGGIVLLTPFPEGELVGAPSVIEGGVEMEVRIGGELVGNAPLITGGVESYFFRPTTPTTPVDPTTPTTPVTVDDFQELPALEFHQIIRRLMGL